VALAVARHTALQEAATRLRGLPEIKAIPLKTNEVEAFLSATLEVSEAPSAVDSKTSVVAHINPGEIARQFDKLRKDPNARAELLEIWKNSEELYQRLTGSGTTPAVEKERLLTRINAKHMIAHVVVSLAKTEEGPTSTRVPSPKGVQRATFFGELAITMAPELPETHIAMGDALMESDQPLEIAEQEYRQALVLSPASTAARVKLAEAIRREGRTPEAVTELREAVRRDPNSALAHTELGFLLAPQDTAGALAEYHEAIRLAPDFIDAHNYLAIALARQQRIPEAVAEFREVVRIDPESALGYYNLGIALADMEEDGASAEAFRETLRINPNHYNARYNAGELFRLEGKLDEAVNQFRIYLRQAPDTPQNRRNIQRAQEFVQTHENP
jgi:tetratricopeptide (TPR) repeat protein